MERKLIQLSPSTRVVSMPSNWLRKNKLSKGDSVFLEEKENDIIISKNAGKGRKNISVDISELTEDLIWQVFDAVYINGYSEIIMKTKNHKQALLLSKVVKYFPGMIIQEERDNYVKVVDIISKEEIDFSSILGRIRNMTLAILDDSLEAVDKKDFGVLFDAKERDYNINSYVSIAFRRLFIEGFDPMAKAPAMGQYVKLLEMIADRICILLRFLALQKKVSSHEKIFLKGFRDLYREESKLFGKYSSKKLSEFEDKRCKLENFGSGVSEEFRIHAKELLKLMFEIEEIATQLNL